MIFRVNANSRAIGRHIVRWRMDYRHHNVCGVPMIIGEFRETSEFIAGECAILVETGAHILDPNIIRIIYEFTRFEYGVIVLRSIIMWEYSVVLLRMWLSDVVQL